MPLQFIQHHLEDAGALRRELEAGLRGDPPAVSPKFLYDALGSRLFDAITALPEYYPTRVEASILAAKGAEIARTAGTGATFIDLGAGNCAKAARLFEQLQPAQYVAVDISVEFLRESLALLSLRYPHLPMVGLGQDFSARLRLPAQVHKDRRLFFYPGSSLGNFSPGAARAFLVSLRRQCEAGGGLLLGLDLVKEKPLLEAAYDDPLGVTAAFNRNLLLRLNALLGSDFRLADWKHLAFYDEAAERVEMHLQARRALSVSLPGGELRFSEGARIHTENSHKYRPEAIGSLLAGAGFGAPAVWTDANRWFALCYSPAA
ncbi:MAG: L-histidine N(alpha)-methyltransferase [Burkholderiales bacterium]|nr:L-histidine N(alpha)-methyltransferase [Burkholderiales bacterium]